jgi:hypothetical protein
MSLKLQTFPHRSLKIFTMIFVAICLIFSFSQYKEKEMYKAHISNSLNTDMQQLVTSIQNNNTLYNEILNTGRISKSQVNSLKSSNEQIRDIILKYRQLAVTFNIRKEGFQYDQSSLNAMKISHLFYDWDQTYKSEFDSKTKLIITKAQELNSKWHSAIKNEGQSYSLSNPSWLELLENIEKNTLSYLKENNVENIENIWLVKTEIK